MNEIADFLRLRYAERRRQENAKRRRIPSIFDDHDVEFRYTVDEGEHLLVDGRPFPADQFWATASEPAPDLDVIADLDAKLAIVDEHAPGGRYWPDSPRQYCKTCGSGEPNEYPTDWPCRTLKLLAQPFAGHPDHKGEGWAP